MHDLRAGSQGSKEPDAGWLDLFRKRYRGGIKYNCSLLVTVVTRESRKK